MKLNWRQAAAGVFLSIVGCHSSGNAPQANPATPQAARTSAGPMDHPPVNAPSTAAPIASPAVSEPVALKFSEDSFNKIQAGLQTGTTRRGVRQYPLGSAAAQSGEDSIPIVITQLTHKKFSQIDITDARTNGFTTADELKESLKKYNPDIQDSDDVTTITFKPRGQ